MMNNLRHEWTLYINFKNDKAQELFLGRIKSIMRDYWYKKRAEDNFEELNKDDIKIPAVGRLQIYITKVKNLHIAELNKNFYNNANIKLAKQIIQVRIDFKLPKENEEEAMCPMPSSKSTASRAEEVKTDLDNKEKTIEGSLNEEFSWRTKEQPAGTLIDLGEFIAIPNNNIKLRITITVPIIKGEKETTYKLGKGEYI